MKDADVMKTSNGHFTVDNIAEAGRAYATFVLERHVWRSVDDQRETGPIWVCSDERM